MQHLVQILKGRGDSIGQALPRLERIAERSGAPGLAAHLGELLQAQGRYDEGHVLCASADPAELDGAAALTWIEGADYRFRKGEMDEWRRVFSAEQQARVSDTLPREIAATFGWNI